jgi:hypothetical protein
MGESLMNNRLLISLFAIQIVSVAHAWDSGSTDIGYGSAPWSLRRNIENVKSNLKEEAKAARFDLDRLKKFDTPEWKQSYYGNAQARLDRLQAMTPLEYAPETKKEWFYRTFNLNDPKQFTPLERLYYDDLKLKIDDLNEAQYRYKQDLNRTESDLDKKMANIENLKAELENLKQQKVNWRYGRPYYNYNEPISPWAQRVKNWFGGWRRK